MDQRTDEWFAARLGKATASRIADVMAKTKTGYGASRENYLSIKEADPGTYDEIIDQSLSLIMKALSMTPGGAIERIVEKLNATEETLK